MSDIHIRHCHATEEFDGCVELQKEVWGFEDIEVVPLRLFVVADKIGGHPYLHSHMLAVRNSHRDRGIGRDIKLAQRNDALLRGFELIEWTFDPLEIKNAFLNIQRLGAISRRYNINQYGVATSPLWGGLPTDRLVAEWWIKSRRVETLLANGAGPKLHVEKTISVPAEIYQWKASPETRPKAADVQARNRDKFLAAFREGLAVIEFERTPRGDGVYHLGRWNETLSYGTEP